MKLFRRLNPDDEMSRPIRFGPILFPCRSKFQKRVDDGYGDRTAAFSSQDRDRGLFHNTQERGLRLFRLYEPNWDPYNQGRPDPVLFDQACYFEKRCGGVSNCDYSAVEARSAIAERGKRAG